jgi:hypothetical protein
MKKLLASLSALAMALSLAGCGETSKLYPASKSEGVFFSVPKNWSGVTTKALNRFEEKSAAEDPENKVSLVKWQVAYSPNKKVKAEDVFTLETPKHPLVFARVRALSDSEINEVSYNSLRDVIVPLTQLINQDTSQDPGFSIVADEEIVEKGARGVRTVYTLTIQDVKQTISQTALVANDRSTMYIFVARCSTTCYNKNRKTINEIVNSFTVRGAR